MDTTGSTDQDCPPQVGFAVVTANDGLGDISSVQYQTFGKGSPAPLENVKNFHYIPDTSKNFQPDDYYIKCLKPVLKAPRSLEKALVFLSGNSNTNGKAAEILVGKSAIVEFLEAGREGGMKVIHGGRTTTVFSETKHVGIQSSVSHPHSASHDTQFISLQSSGLKVKDKIEAFSSVNILSGICLFSQEHLGCLRGESTLLSDSEIALMDVPVPFGQRPTLYEIESLVRLPITIANIVSTLPATLDVTITLDVPRIQYYAFQLDLYARGLCSREYVNSWLDTIDRRHDQVAEVFEKAVRDTLERRGVNRKNLKIELSAGLENLVPYIRETISQGNALDLSADNLLQELLEIDPLFREYYEHLPPSRRPPQNLVDLCYTSYTFQALRPIFQRVRESQSSNAAHKNNSLKRQLLINIDNIAELRIYTQAREILKEYQKRHSSTIRPLILGIFPRELVFTAKNTGRSNIYANNIGQYIYDESGGGINIVNPGDIVAKVYGVGVTQRVVDFMTQAGMFNVSSMLDDISSGESSNGSDGG
ncbi:hypothetical protein Q9L58_001638 [Maublancomyces gigas]|uniref:Uncharacterized protein n=1 Tax=Discina gigas TaxID=1032678 RepID=A0ABR3GTY6_9PEZI